MEYRREIDGLRALAVLPVILFHAGYETFSGGFVGVDIFFVISGYLITSIILAEQQAGTFSLVDFYERRARRILPMLFFVMAVSIPFAWLWLMPEDMQRFSQGAAAVSVFSSNILFWLQSGYFDMAAELKPLLHTWSLAVEEQFYLFLPLFLIAAWGSGIRWIVVVLAFTALMSLSIAQWGAVNAPNAAFFLLPTRGWELLLGAFIAFYFFQQKTIPFGPLTRQWLSSVGLLLILYAIFTFSDHTLFPGLNALIPTMGALLIIAFATHDTLVGKLLGNRAFVGIGLISYSAYLWHQPLFAFARHASVQEPSRLAMGMLSLVAIALAYCSWRYIEQPFRRKDKVSRKQAFTFAAAASAGFLVFGWIGQQSDGFEKPRTTIAQQQVLQTVAHSPKREECHTKGDEYMKPEETCTYAAGNITWATFGDSHTVELAYALAKKLQPRQEGLRHFSFSDCPPAYGTVIEAHRPCSQWTQEAVDFIAKDPNIRNVVVSYRIHSNLFGEHGYSYPLLPSGIDAAEREKRWHAYIALLQHLTAAGKNVILVLQTPELPKDVGALIFRDKSSPQQVRGVSRQWWDNRTRFVHARLDHIPNEVTIIDPTPMFCDHKACDAVRNGKALYFDTHHPSIYGGKLLASAIMRSTDQPLGYAVALQVLRKRA